MGTFQQFWSAIIGQEAASPPAPKVVLHDPASSKPHDLDDPFFDSRVQERIGVAIAKATEKE